jgi:hypothetical protein
MRNLKVSTLGICALAVASVVGLGAQAGHASIIQYIATGTGTSTGDSSTFSGSARIVVNTNNGTVSITLTNSTAPTYSAGDLLHGIGFTIASGAGDLSSASISSITGNVISVDGSGNITNVGAATLASNTGPKNWQISADSTTSITLMTGAQSNVIGPPQGGGTYSDANSSINGNPGHSDFLQDSPTLVLGINGLLGADNVVVDSATIYYTTSGLAAKTNINGGTPLPEPAAFSLLAIPMVGLLLRKRRTV